MSTATATRDPNVFVPERVFRMNGVDLPDPAPDLEPQEALQLYARQYPHLRRAMLADPQMEGDVVIYEVEKAPVQTKGGV